MSLLSALSDSELAACLAYHPVYDCGFGNCIEEGYPSWEKGVAAYTWQDGDPVYPGGAA